MKDEPVSNIVSLATNPRDSEAEALRIAARASLEESLDELGDDIGGFAIVILSRNGDGATSTNHQFLPWGRQPMANFIHDILTVHCARLYAEEDRERPGGCAG